MDSNTLRFNITAKVLGNFDTIVCGGGTAGVVAALASARNGAKTLLIEKGYFLGGMMTMGNAFLTKFISGVTSENGQNTDSIQIAGGIPLEFANDMIKNGNAVGTNGKVAYGVSTDSHEFKLYIFEALKRAGVKIMLHSKILSVVMDDSAISAVVFDTKEGPMAAYSKYVIDATGDADVSYMSGAECSIGAASYSTDAKNGNTNAEDMYPVGTMYRIGGIDYNRFFEWLRENPERFTPYPYAEMSKDEFFDGYERGDSVSALIQLDDNDSLNFLIHTYPRDGIMLASSNIPSKNLSGTNADELTQAEYEVLLEETNSITKLRKSFPGFENAYIADVPQAGIRETRHVTGEYLLTSCDVISGNDFYDSIGLSAYPIDIPAKGREYTNIHPEGKNIFQIPFRCLVAKNTDNLLLCGRLISASHEAFECIRHTVCCMVTGEAAGTAAAILSDDGGKAKDIDIEKLRNLLKINGAKC